MFSFICHCCVSQAQLLDRGSGARVKFRLAGVILILLVQFLQSLYFFVVFKETFPPNIYYKIFIQSPIQDVCANAPRDYTNVCYQRTTARHTHNKGAPDVRLGIAIVFWWWWW